MGTEGTYLDIIIAIYDKPTVNIIVNSEKLKTFLLRWGKKQTWFHSSVFTTIQHSFHLYYSTFTTIIQNNFGSSTHAMREEN